MRSTTVFSGSHALLLQKVPRLDETPKKNRRRYQGSSVELQSHTIQNAYLYHEFLKTRDEQKMVITAVSCGSTHCLKHSSLSE